MPVCRQSLKGMTTREESLFPTTHTFRLSSYATTSSISTQSFYFRWGLYYTYSSHYALANPFSDQSILLKCFHTIQGPSTHPLYPQHNALSSQKSNNIDEYIYETNPPLCYTFQLSKLKSLIHTSLFFETNSALQ